MQSRAALSEPNNNSDIVLLRNRKKNIPKTKNGTAKTVLAKNEILLSDSEEVSEFASILSLEQDGQAEIIADNINYLL